MTLQVDTLQPAGVLWTFL